jgi:hypothetical protein
MWYKEASLEDKIKKLVKKFRGNGIKVWVMDKPKTIFVSFGDWADDIGRFLKELKWAAGGAYKIEHDFEVGSPSPDKRKWKKVAAGNVQIYMDDYASSLRKVVMDLVAFTERSKNQTANFRLNWPLVQSTFQKYNLGWQWMQDLQKIVQERNQMDLLHGVTFLSNWIARDKYVTPGMSIQQKSQAHSELTEALRQLRTYADQLEESAVDYQPYDAVAAEQDIQRLTQETYANMQKLAVFVQSAIGRIEEYNGTPVTIMARRVDKNDQYFDAETSASIEFGPPGGDMSPSFTIFEISEKGAVIDDVLEAGDTDFFTDAGVQADYFNLLKELKNPGSSASGGKVLTLYTARPIKDRHLYENATQIPSNIFLTNSLSSAEGIAMDLGGSNEIRDVWKVQIDSRYLVQTLEGMERQYQVVGKGMVPVKRMVLISPGNPNRTNAAGLD